MDKLMQEYLKQAFKNSLTVSQEDIFFHCGVVDDGIKEALGVQDVIRQELKLYKRDMPIPL